MACCPDLAHPSAADGAHELVFPCHELLAKRRDPLELRRHPLLDGGRQILQRGAWLEARLPQLEAGQATPFEIADALLARSADLLSGRTT